MLAGWPLLLGGFAQHRRRSWLGLVLGLASSVERLLRCSAALWRMTAASRSAAASAGLRPLAWRLTSARRGRLGLDPYGFGLHPGGGEQLLGLGPGALVSAAASARPGARSASSSAS